MSRTSFTSASARAAVLGAVLGFVFAAGPSCGSNRQISRCNAQTCSGCCDATGTCQTGSSDINCGTNGATCSVCGASQLCSKAAVTAGTGGACATLNADGGVVRTDAGVFDAGTCDPSSCATGCCSGNTCVNPGTSARCGTGGAVCIACNTGSTCVSGACQVCNGCVDISTGACRPGNEAAACGRPGSFCAYCDTNVGQMCSNNLCTGGAGCNASNCADGCCDGNTCLQRANYTNFQCGSGTAGTACVSCTARCDNDAGTCIGGSGGGGDGGLFPGGLGGAGCDPTDPNACGPNQCCNELVGCVDNGSSAFPLTEFCGVGMKCNFCRAWLGEACNPTTYACK